MNEMKMPSVFVWGGIRIGGPSFGVCAFPSFPPRGARVRAISSDRVPSADCLPVEVHDQVRTNSEARNTAFSPFSETKRQIRPNRQISVHLSLQHVNVWLRHYGLPAPDCSWARGAGRLGAGLRLEWSRGATFRLAKAPLAMASARALGWSLGTIKP